MKNFLLTILFSFFIASTQAQHQVIPLSKTYLDIPHTINTSKSYDEVWSDIVHLLQQNDMAGKILDKVQALLSLN